MKDLRISSLNDLYGGLLTERQTEILKNYYDYDLSYGEIGEIYGITRQAVAQIIENSSKQLECYDNALNLFEIFDALNALRLEVRDENTLGRLDAIIALFADKRSE